MNANALLHEMERLTGEMLDSARREQWPELAGLEERRRQLLAVLDVRSLGTPQEQATLRRIVDNNNTLTQRVQGRKDDLGLLLSAFGEAAAKAD